MAARVQITADDFGASRAINEAVAHAHRAGVLTAASLMVTGDAVGEAVALAQALPGLSVGLHLVLAEGRPASPPETIPDLVDARGRFPDHPARAGLALWWRRQRVARQLEVELRAQLDAYRASGLGLEHVDGHHHLHLHPVVWRVLTPLLREYDVRWARLVDEDGLGRMHAFTPGADLHAGIFRLLSRHARRRAGPAGVGAADRVYGLRATERLDEGELVRLLEGLPEGRFEIFSHPRRDTEQGRREEAALTSPAVRKLVDARGHRLVGSRELALATPRLAASGT